MRNVFILGIFAVALIIFAGCGKKSGVFGQPLQENKATRIADVLTHPEQFTGKTTRVEATIVDECPAGGWFMLKDDTGIIYVNLHPSNFAIPQAVGGKAVAEGVVKKQGPQISVVGKGVEIK